MWNTALESTVKYYEVIRGELMILIIGFLGGLLGMAFDYFGLRWNDNLLFALFTIISAILSFPILLIFNYLKLAIPSVQIEISKSEVSRGCSACSLSCGCGSPPTGLRRRFRRLRSSSTW